MCGRRLDRRSRRALVGLLRFRHSDGTHNNRDGSHPAYADCFSGILAYAFLAALLTLPFQQWFCLRLDAVPRRLELHERRKS